MFSKYFPTFHTWRQGPSWRLATWWPSDSIATQQHSLLRLLAVGRAERLDIATLVANFASEHRGRYRIRLQRLARRLNEGTPLVDALEQTPDVLSDEAVLTLRFATQTGTLNEAYRDLLNPPEPMANRAQITLRQNIGYIAFLLIVWVVVVSFLLTNVIPTLSELYDDLELDPYQSPIPWTFDVLTTAGEWMMNFAPLWILGLLAALALMWSVGLRRLVRRGLPGRLTAESTRSRSALLMRTLSYAIEAGRPLPAALSTLARYHFDPSTRQRLLLARNEIEQGSETWDSLVVAGLMSRQDARALVQASSTASQLWILRRLSDWHRQQSGRRLQSRLAWLHPIAVLLVAGGVLVTAAAVFQFLTNLIQGLA